MTREREGGWSPERNSRQVIDLTSIEMNARKLMRLPCPRGISRSDPLSDACTFASFATTFYTPRAKFLLIPYLGAFLKVLYLNRTPESFCMMNFVFYFFTRTQ